MHILKSHTTPANTLFLFVILLLTPIANAHDFNSNKLEIGHPWARATSAVVETGAVYLSINNHSDITEHLLSVEVAANVAQQAYIHQTQYTHNMAKMREAKQGLTITAESTITLSPGGTHIMLVGLTQPLVLGAKFPMILHFKNSGAITVEVWVEDTLKLRKMPSSHQDH